MYKTHNGDWDGHSVFVFGSNLAGRHGKGAAKFALMNCGAVYGEGFGRYGSSYAIPTKDIRIKTLPLDAIERHVKTFLEHAARHKETTFFVTAIGCGLAGYETKDIAPMFSEAPDNCLLSALWVEYLEGRKSEAAANPMP